jgi:T4 RnlA family RNA ligase
MGKYILPSYADCREICDAHNDVIFYESKHIIDGFTVSIFNYRMAFSFHFENPVPNSNLRGDELRGLTFVKTDKGYDRYLLLNKFWNLNQTPCSMYSEVSDLKIKNIYGKEDGSIASFIRLPNGRVLGKSKNSFSSDQALAIQKVYDTNENIKRFVDYTLDNGISAIFEYTSESNRIVLNYGKTDLILLRLRDNTTGEYLDLSDYKHLLDGISTPNVYNYTLDDMIDLKKTIEGVEGWIVMFENSKMIKIKVDWYIHLHTILTEDVNRENILIKYILDDKIDDLLGQLGENQIETREKIIDIEKKVVKYIEDKFVRISDIVKTYTGDQKEFARIYLKDEDFSIVMNAVRGKDILSMITERIGRETSHLMDARKFLEKISE